MLIKFGSKVLFNSNSLSSKNGGNGVYPESGRSSIERTYSNFLTGALGFYDVLQPEVSQELRRLIQVLCKVDPDLSQGVKNVVAIGNTGHKLIIQDKSDKRIKAAIDYINSKAYQIYKISAGVDGLINQEFRQLAVDGVSSTEDVIDPTTFELSKVVLVPAWSIFFQYLEGDWRAHQQCNYMEHGSDMVRLNDLTYRYYALTVEDNIPYAIPPFLGAIRTATSLERMYESIDRIIMKLGLLGLTNVKVKKPSPEQNESPEEYRRRYQDYLNQVAGGISKAFENGVIVSPEDQELTHFSITGEARGVKDIWQIIEERHFSGMGFDPAMMGRAYQKTETFAKVVYLILLRSIGNMRRIVKRRREDTYRLALLLAGLDVESISLSFNSNEKLQPQVDALAEKIETETAIRKAAVGMVSLDTAAQERGYKGWHDKKRFQENSSTTSLKREFEFDNNAQEYRILIPSHDLDRYNLSKESDEEKRARIAENKLQEWVTKYLTKVLPFYSELPEEITDFALNYARENIEEIVKDSQTFLKAVKGYISIHSLYKNTPTSREFKRITEEASLKIGKHYKEADSSVFDEGKSLVFVFNKGDVAACEFFASIDQYYFSKFIDNQDFGRDINAFITKFLERGEALFGAWTEEAENEFITRFRSALEGDIYQHMKRIVNSAVNRIRVYSHVEQLHDGGFLYGRVNEVLDSKTCKVCELMNGKKFLVSSARIVTQRLAKAGTVEKAVQIIKKTNIANTDEVKELIEKDEIKIKNNKGLPPYHVSCRGRIQGVFE